MSSWKQLVFELASPEKSLRISGLEEALHFDPSPELLELLQQGMSRETDAECRRLFLHVRHALQGRLGRGTAPTPPSTDSEEFSRLTPDEKLLFLRKLVPSQIAQLAPSAPDMLIGEDHPLIVALVIRIFSSTWPPNRWDQILFRLKATSLTERLAAVEALLNHCPDLLVEHLPPLLVEKDPRIRSLAIRGLAAVSPETALQHLEQLLLHPEISYRYTALGNCLLLPFATVKSLLLKFIALETNPDLLERAGHILLANPDVHIPFSLREMAVKSAPEKAEFLEKTLLSILLQLEDAGLLGENHQTYLAKLAEWEKKCEIWHFLHSFMDYQQKHLQSPSPETEGWLMRHLDDPRFQDSLLSETSPQQVEDIRAFLDDLAQRPFAAAPDPKPASEFLLPPIEPAQPTPSGSARKPAPIPAPVLQAPPEPAEDSAFFYLPQDRQIRLIASWEEEDKPTATWIMAALFSDPQTPPAVTLSLLRAASRLSVPGYADRAAKLLSASDPALVAAALDYLALIDPEQVHLHLMRFLASDDLRIRSTTLKILRRLDPQRATSLLESLLESSDSRKQELAVTGMVHFDFPVVQDMLFRFLNKNPAPDLAEKGLHLFAANPSPEGLYHLFALEKSLLGSPQTQALEIRKEITAFLQEAKILTTNTFAEQEAVWEKRWQDEHPKPKRPSRTGAADRGKALAVPAPVKVVEETPGDSFLQKVISWLTDPL